MIAETGAEVVRPYDDARVIAGQGTCALELLDQAPDLDVVVAPVGGGLVSGTAIVVTSLSAATRAVAAGPAAADDAFRSFHEGRIVPSDDPTTARDGLRTSRGELIFRVLRERASDAVTVDEESIVAAMRTVWERMKIVVEPSAAVPLAAARAGNVKGARIGSILTGGQCGSGRATFRAMTLGRGAKAVVLLAAIVVVFAGISAAKDLLVPLLLAAFIAAVTAPLALWLYDRGFPRGLAVLIALLVDISALAGLGALVGSSLNSFYARLPEYQQEMAGAVTEATSFLAAYGVEPESLLKTVNPGSLMDLVAVLFKSIAGMVSSLLLMLVIVVFMLFEATGLRTKLERVFGDDPERLHRASRDITRYLLVKTATSGATGLAVGLLLAAFGVDLPVLWGLLAFLLNYIPTLGSIIAAIPTVLLAWLQLGTGGALGVAAGYIVINFAIGFLEPRLFGRALGLSPLVVFLSMVFWFWILGPVGALLSVPLTMILKIALANTEDLEWIAVLLAPVQEPEGKRTSWIPAALQRRTVPRPPDAEE